MTDTDRLIGAFFAAAMTAKHPDPTLDAFFVHYDSCLAGLVEREVKAAAMKEEQIQAAHKAAWGS